MSSIPTPDGQSGGPSQPLQFDKAEFGEKPALSCAFCKAPITVDYFQVNRQTACADCRGKLEQFIATRGSLGEALRALSGGVGAGIAGFLIYWGIRAATGYEFALVAILVGWMVGKSIRWGAPRGGRLYQLLAIFLTYCSIASTYVPDIVHGMRERPAEEHVEPGRSRPALKNQSDNEPSAARGLKNSATERPTDDRRIPLMVEIAVAFGIALAMPFLLGVSNILGWIIMAVGLLQAWRLTKRVPLEIAGPFQMGGIAPAA